MLANRTEDYLRKATGMPPRPGSREERRQQRASQQSQYRSSESEGSYYYNSSGYSNGSAFRSRSRRRSRYSSNEPLIPREYAEDVEFVEIKSFSQSTIKETVETEKQYHESQVSDVEWVEIKQKA